MVSSVQKVRGKRYVRGVFMVQGISLSIPGYGGCRGRPFSRVAAPLSSLEYSPSLFPMVLRVCGGLQRDSISLTASDMVL